MREALKWSRIKVDPVAVDAVLVENNLPYSIAQILVSRGIDQAEKVKSFLTPRLAGLSDPFYCQIWLKPSRAYGRQKIRTSIFLSMEIMMWMGLFNGFGNADAPPAQCM